MKDIDQERFEKLMKELEDKTVIVEGKKDEEALKRLGLKNIIAIKGKPLHEIVEGVSGENKQIVILTDFDKTGRKIYSRLNYLLRKHKKSVNSRLRGEFMNLGKNKIEDINNVAHLKEVDVYVKVSANVNKICHTRSNKRKRSNRKTRYHRGHIRPD